MLIKQTTKALDIDPYDIQVNLTEAIAVMIVIRRYDIAVCPVPIRHSGGFRIKNHILEECDKS
jgi:hypothetical protein